MAAIALGIVAAVPGSALAADMTLKGRFTCNDGQPLADMRVELMHTKTRLLPEIWPNQTVSVAAGRTGPNGEWEWRVRGGETNWRVRAVLVNNDVGVKDFRTPGITTPTRCGPRTTARWPTTGRRWSRGRSAGCGGVQGGRRRLPGGHRRTSNPAGPSRCSENAPTSGVPFTPYTDVFWPGNYSADTEDRSTDAPVKRSVAQHEYAHIVRHAARRGQGALRSSTAGGSGTCARIPADACTPTNHGFAFNEGWAEYWADEVRATPCPNARTSASSATWRSSSSACNAACVRAWTRGRMVAGPGPEPWPDPLDVRLQQRAASASRPNRSSRPARRSGRRPRCQPWSRCASGRGRALLSDIGRLITRARSTVSKASGFAERALLRARLDQARSLRSTLSYLRSRAEQKRIARLSDRKQVDLLAAKQRAYMRKVRSISAAALRYIADRLRRDGNRDGAQLMKPAGARGGGRPARRTAGGRAAAGRGGSGKADPSVEHSRSGAGTDASVRPRRPEGGSGRAPRRVAVLRPRGSARARCATGAPTSGRLPPAHRPRASSWSRRACRP